MVPKTENGAENGAVLNFSTFDVNTVKSRYIVVFDMLYLLRDTRS